MSSNNTLKTENKMLQLCNTIKGIMVVISDQRFSPEIPDLLYNGMGCRAVSVLSIIWTGSKTNLNLIFFLDSSKRLEHIVKGAI